MMISRAQIDQILRVYRTSKAGRPGTGNLQGERAADATADALHISVSPQDVAAVKDVLKTAPDVREDRVREVSRKLREGTYHVPAEEVAEKLLGRLMADRLR